MQRHCEIHNTIYEATEVKIGGRLITTGRCPECLRDLDRKEQEKIEKDRAEERKRFFKSSNIEPAYYGATFESFKADTEELQKAVSTVKKMILGEIMQIVMIGKNGTGKTHLAIAAIQEIGEGCIYSMYEISTRIRETYTARPKETELQVVNDLAWQRLLVIDELGRTKGSETEANWLSYIIDKRHVRNLPTILISNKHTRKTCPNKGCENCLENYIGEDIMSRLNEWGVILRMDGEDYRRKNRVRSLPAEEAVVR